MPKAIVFDIGGVLVGLDMEGCIRAFREELGFEAITQLIDKYKQKGIYGELEGGKLSEARFKELVLAESNPGRTPEDVEAAMGKLLIPKMDPRTVKIVRELHSRYPLYLLSNNNPISIRHCYRVLSDNGLDPEVYFKEKFISSELQLMKPYPEIFNYAIEHIGLPASEILFIDDSIHNVEGARAVGLDARLYTPGTDMSLLLADC